MACFRTVAAAAALAAAVALLCATGASATLMMPAFFSDGMVLQTNHQYGARSFVWGWAEPNDTVTVEFSGTTYTVAADADGAWKTQLNPHAISTKAGSMTVTAASDPSSPKVINDISIGDVYLCGGQSNMVFPLELSLNATAEIASAANVKNMKLLNVKGVPMTSEQRDIPPGSTGWMEATPETVANFSAVCYMTVRDATAAIDDGRPVGLILSAVGGTRVEAWMEPDAVRECTGPHTPYPVGHGTNVPTGLWNGSMVPLAGLTIRSALWYQGESNAEGHNTTDYYACMFQSLITSWRQRWQIGDFSFVYMQLPPSTLASAPPAEATGRPEVRAAQQLTLPSPGGPVDTTGMAVVIDLGGVSAWGVDHPPAKNLMSRRLALALRHVAFAQQSPNDVNFTGPVVAEAVVVSTPASLARLQLRLQQQRQRLRGDTAFAFAGAPVDGASVSVSFVAGTATALQLEDVANCTTCCKGSTPFELSYDHGATWANAAGTIDSSGSSVSITAANASATTARYAWTDFVQCALYNEWGLPAGPFTVNVTSSVEVVRPVAVTDAITPASATADTAPVAATPPMGFNSWNFYHCNVDEQAVLATAQAFKDTGLGAVGYEYINLDDCWQVDRAADGTIQPDPVRFPSGIKALAAEVHAMGFKFGVYTAAHQFTCQDRPGSYQHEAQDAAFYCDAKVDYLKIDQCGGKKWPHANTSWIKFRQGFDECRATTNHSIVESIESCGTVTGCGEWIADVANLWRIGGDIQANWASVTSIIDHNNGLWTLAGPGHWNDPDMLEVGNVGLSMIEQKSHFTMWCIMAAPLLSGTDLSSASADTLAILGAPEVVAVDQDPLGVQGRRVASSKNASAGWVREQRIAGGYTLVPPGTVEVWARPLQDGSIAAALLNRGDAAEDITLAFNDLPWPKTPTAKSFDVRDLWARKDLGSFGASAGYTASAVESHGVAMVKVTATSA